LLESAEGDEAITRALQIIFGTIRQSWRNSEAMEKESGYSILAGLLESKLQNETLQNFEEPRTSLAYQTLSQVLEFLGYKSNKPEDSVLNNPLAYRILLVDLNVWRLSTPEVQKLYYDQFTAFGVGSKYHVFNTKRLSRMRIIRKWLEVLKGDAFSAETLQYFLAAFRPLFLSALTTDVMRSLALYVTWAFEHSTKQRSQWRRGTQTGRMLINSFGPLPRRSTAPSAAITGTNPSNGSRSLSFRELGIAMLKLYSEIICQEDEALVKKFARAVSNKVRSPRLTGLALLTTCSGFCT